LARGGALRGEFGVLPSGVEQVDTDLVIEGFVGERVGDGVSVGRWGQRAVHGSGAGSRSHANGGNRCG
jgi:hypothetical protein